MLARNIWGTTEGNILTTIYAMTTLAIKSRCILTINFFFNTEPVDSECFKGGGVRRKKERLQVKILKHYIFYPCSYIDIYIDMLCNHFSLFPFFSTFLLFMFVFMGKIQRACVTLKSLSRPDNSEYIYIELTNQQK